MAVMLPRPHVAEAEAEIGPAPPHAAARPSGWPLALGLLAALAAAVVLWALIVGAIAFAIRLVS